EPEREREAATQFAQDCQAGPQPARPEATPVKAVRHPLVARTAKPAEELLCPMCRQCQAGYQSDNQQCPRHIACFSLVRLPAAGVASAGAAVPGTAAGLVLWHGPSLRPLEPSFPR